MTYDLIRRDLHRIHLRQEHANVAHGEAAGIQREDLVVEAREAARMFGISTGANVPWRSRGIASGRAPSSVSTVLALVPLR